jgi:hypothetical protein
MAGNNGDFLGCGLSFRHNDYGEEQKVKWKQSDGEYAKRTNTTSSPALYCAGELSCFQPRFTAAMSHRGSSSAKTPRDEDSMEGYPTTSSMQDWQKFVLGVSAALKRE